jgi:hypothetical protein
MVRFGECDIELEVVVGVRPTLLEIVDGRLTAIVDAGLLSAFMESIIIRSNSDGDGIVVSGGVSLWPVGWSRPDHKVSCFKSIHGYRRGNTYLFSTGLYYINP